MVFFVLPPSPFACSLFARYPTMYIGLCLLHAPRRDPPYGIVEDGGLDTHIVMTRTTGAGTKHFICFILGLSASVWCVVR